MFQYTRLGLTYSVIFGSILPQTGLGESAKLHPGARLRLRRVGISGLREIVLAKQGAPNFSNWRLRSKFNAFQLKYLIRYRTDPDSTDQNQRVSDSMSDSSFSRASRARLPRASRACAAASRRRARAARMINPSL